MGSRRELTCIVMAALVLARLFVTPPAWARAESEAARAERTQGTVALNLGHYDDAVEHLAKAYELTQDPVLLFQLAQAYRLGGKADKAIAAYSAFLRAAGGSARYRAQIERAAADIESIATFVVTHPRNQPDEKTPASAKPAESAPADEPAAPVASPPAAVAVKPAAEPAALEPPAVASPALTPKPPVPPPPAVSFASEPASEPTPTSRPVYKRWWFWTGVALAAAAGGAAAWWYTQPTSQTPPSTYGAVRVLP
jgi:hypothetical protein